MLDQTPQQSQARDPQSLSHFVPASQPAPTAHNQGMKNIDPIMPRMNTTTVAPVVPLKAETTAVRKGPVGPPQAKPALRKTASVGATAAATAGSNKDNLVLSLSFVGMKYRGRHVFSSVDIIVLQNDDKNPYDKNAIKVMLKKNGNLWKHVAYVAGDDAKRLRELTTDVRPDLADLKFVSNSYTKDTAYYRMTIPRK